MDLSVSPKIVLAICIEKSILTHMKRFALLRLEHGGNKVIMDFTGTKPAAIAAFNATFTANTPKLDADGYAKVNETVSLCVAEYHENFTTLN